MAHVLDRRVYIVDDDEALRRTLRRMLTDGGIYTEEFGSGPELLSGYSGRPVGCILLDLKLPGMDGLELLHRIKGLPPRNPVIMISGAGDIPTAVEAVKTGALDFLQKPFRKDVLLGLVDRAFEQLEDADPVYLNGLERLTPREKEILVAFGDGASNKIVAARFGLSPRTIEMHRFNIIRKLDAENMTQVLFLARDCGLIR